MESISWMNTIHQGRPGYDVELHPAAPLSKASFPLAPRARDTVKMLAARQCISKRAYKDAVVWMTFVNCVA